MDKRIVEFAEVLRENGVRVGTSEVRDALVAANAVGVANPERFKAALLATLIKREQDVPSFQKAFTYFFSGLTQSFQGLDRSLFRQLGEEGQLDPDELQRLSDALARLLPALTPLTQAMLEGDFGAVAKVFLRAALRLDWSGIQTSLQGGFFSRRLMAASGLEQVRADLTAIQSNLQRQGLSQAALELATSHLARALEKLEKAARSEVQRQIHARLRGPELSWMDRSLQILSSEDLQAAETAVRRLAERLKGRLRRRENRSRRGTLNIKRILRRNLSCGGVPMLKMFNTKRPRRPDVVVLCDVSDSVKNVSRLMLLFTHTLQGHFAHMRSFVFVSDIGEMTSLLKQASVAEAMDLAMADSAISLNANSNYGRAFTSFVQNHLGSVSRKTTVFVIGDGRNNHNAPHDWALGEIRRRARRLVWICSEAEPSWGAGDSEMPTYAKHCSQTVVVQSLTDLLGMADKLLLS